MTPAVAMKVLVDRREYLERQALARRLTDRPCALFYREIAAIDLALTGLASDALADLHARVCALERELHSARDAFADAALKKPSLLKQVQRIDAVLGGGS